MLHLREHKKINKLQRWNNDEDSTARNNWNARKPRIFFFVLIQSRHFGILCICFFLVYTITHIRWQSNHLKCPSNRYITDLRLLASNTCKYMYWLFLPSMLGIKSRRDKINRKNAETRKQYDTCVILKNWNADLKNCEILKIHYLDPFTCFMFVPFYYIVRMNLGIHI